MQIAVFDNLPEGGAKRVVFEQIKYLSAHNTIIYYTNNQQSIFPFNDYATVKRYNLESSRWTGMLRPLQELGLLRIFFEYKNIARDIQKNNIAYSIVHHCKQTQSPFLLPLLRSAGIPSLYYIEEPLRIAAEPELFPIVESNLIKKSYEMLRRSMIQAIDTWCCAAASVHVTNSTFTQHNVQRYYQQKSTVIHPGVDTHIFKPLKTALKHFLFIGEKEVINGYELLQAALKEAQIRIPVEYVTFKNAQFRKSDTELAKVYAESYATLCLSKQEPFGLTAIESSACMTPVIAVRDGGYLDTIDDDNGVLIEQSPHALATAMEKMYTDQSYRSKHAIHAREKVLKRFSWEEHGKKIETIGKQLCT